MVAETFYVPTDDGWQLAVHRFAPQGQPRKHPVLMLHGFGANRLHFDLDPRYSYAQSAAQRGFDVYVLELRGAGFSVPPGNRDRTLFQWGFGDYAQRDVPTAVTHILERTGALALHGVGHSMGGMLLYSLAVSSSSVLKSVVTVGAPYAQCLEWGDREKRLIRLATSLAPERTQGRVPLKRLFGAAGYFVPLGARLADGLLLNASNVEPYVLHRMAQEAIADVPLQLVMEITGQMSGAKSEPYAYEQSMHHIQVPVLVVGGVADKVAPPNAVKAALPMLGAPDVRYREMGIAHGDRADYGHVDLFVGRNAPDEVYPFLNDFLEEMD
jgi:predicted alpha/beta hydrolase